ncbi:hypothetical protein C8250_042530 [Streptomyces sp. So13.3]|uniref:hypothetical protein n=1 Tax=unclassified Streptomyces TaxID=2593676 RepID=UPI0011063AD9|nr:MULTISPECIES: hypothetical protein [unclassified Streptomyces]MCZ4103519.1 hypothetical protein [Streptomyces sp. H39-C1]QNA77568.1 hypothetical protein C8250_042530 [Streptomyces sp. So13.3]
MTRWIRTHDGESATWSYFELDDEQWASRQVDLQGPKRTPVTAAALGEVLQCRDHGDAAATAAYERQYGVLAEGALTGWEDADAAAEVTEDVFERIWAAARLRLASTGSSTEHEETP